MVSRTQTDSTPLGNESNPLRAIIVGSGPSGFYAAQALLDSGYHVEVDVIERLPTPFGLIRYGVAPDHVKLKSASDVFTGIAQDPRICFWGNITVGCDINVDELRSLFHVVVLATGSDSDRKLNIAGEDLRGVYAAREFVGWYNGHPDHTDLTFDLRHESVVVIGHGNVAIDICRLLTTPIDTLRKTDIAQHALEVLFESRIKEVHLVGRRGPVQSRFTPKELRELVLSDNVQVIVSPEDLTLNPACEMELSMPGARNALKNMKLLNACAKQSSNQCSMSIYLHFRKSPTAFSGTDSKLNRAHFEMQRLTGAAGEQRAQPTGITCTLDAGVLFKSVGYQGTRLPGVPFDSSLGVIPNEKGRLGAPGNSPNFVGLYVTGWIKRGATGVIGTNRADSIETVTQIVADLKCLNTPRKGRTLLHRLLTDRARQVVSFNDWLHIEKIERARGHAVGKSAEKIASVSEMLSLVSADSHAGNPKSALGGAENGKRHAH